MYCESGDKLKTPWRISRYEAGDLTRSFQRPYRCLQTLQRGKDMNQTDKLFPAQAVRACCAGCLGLPQWNRAQIEACEGDKAHAGPCPIFPYRLGRRIQVKVFRRYCFHCTNGDRAYVADCPTKGCPVHPYRHGRNPALTGKGCASALLLWQQKRRGSINSGLESTIGFQDDLEPM